MTHEEFEALPGGAIITNQDGTKYLKIEQHVPYRLQGVVARLSDGKLFHWSRALSKYPQGEVKST